MVHTHIVSSIAHCLQYNSIGRQVKHADEATNQMHQLLVGLAHCGGSNWQTHDGDNFPLRVQDDQPLRCRIEWLQMVGWFRAATSRQIIWLHWQKNASEGWRRVEVPLWCVLRRSGFSNWAGGAWARLAEECPHLLALGRVHAAKECSASFAGHDFHSRPFPCFN
jgi:hypothetical protein